MKKIVWAFVLASCFLALPELILDLSVRGGIHFGYEPLVPESYDHMVYAVKTVRYEHADLHRAPRAVLRHPASGDRLPLHNAEVSAAAGTIPVGSWVYFRRRPDGAAPDVIVCRWKGAGPERTGQPLDEAPIGDLCSLTYEDLARWRRPDNWLSPVAAEARPPTPSS